MISIGWCVAVVLCLLSLLCQRASAAAASLAHSPRKLGRGGNNNGGSPLMQKPRASSCSVCGFRLCHCLGAPRAAIRNILAGAPYIVSKAGSGMLGGGLFGIATSAVAWPFASDEGRQKLKASTLDAAKFGFVRSGTHALFEVARDKSDYWNDVAADALAGAYLSSPTNKLRDRCLCGVACGCASFLVERLKVRRQRRAEPELKEDNSWKQEQYAW